MKKLSIILFIILMSFCPACAPLPHFATKVPNVSGTLTMDGVPLSGVIVQITNELNDESCSKAASSTITDAGGYFELERVSDFKFFGTMGDHIYSNKLCIIKGGKAYIGYMDEGTGYPPKSIKLNCNINTESKLADRYTSGADNDKLSICTMVK